MSRNKLNLEVMEAFRDASTPQEKMSLIDAIANRPDEEIIEVLMQSLSDHHPRVRDAGVAALVKLAPATVEPLIKQYYNTGDQATQALIIQALARIAGEGATDLLIDVVGVSVANHCQGNVRRVAACGLGEIAGNSHNREIVQKIIDKLVWAMENAEDWGLRYAAVLSLQQICTKDAKAAIEKALNQETEPVVRVRMQRALSQMQGA